MTGFISYLPNYFPSFIDGVGLTQVSSARIYLLLNKMYYVIDCTNCLK